MSDKSVWIPQQYKNLIFPEARFSSFPNPIQYGVRRRSNRMGNQIERYSLFLTAASLPSETESKLVSVPQTVHTTTVEQGTQQIIDSLNSVEKSLAKKFDDLRESGLDKYINKQLQEMMHSKKETTVSAPENAEPISSDIVSTREIKSNTPRKRKVDATMPILAHEYRVKSKKGKR